MSPRKQVEQPEENFDRFADQPAPAERPKPKFADVRPARLRMALGAYYRLQRDRIAISNGFKGVHRDYDNYSDKELELDQGTFVDPLKKQEAYFAKVIGEMIQDDPVAQWIVENVRGMAWNLSAQLLGLIGDITLFPNVSHLWSYAGLRPDQRRTAGVKSNWHPDLKRLMYNIAVSLLKAGGYYAGVYEYFRAAQERRAEDFYRMLRQRLGGNHPVTLKINAEFALALKIAQHNESEKAKASADPDYKPKPEIMKWNRLQGATLDGALALGMPKPEKRDYNALVEAIKFLADLLGMKHVAFDRDRREIAVLATPAITPAHRHARALRKVEKVFLEHIFLQWTKIRGRPVTPPWVFGPGNHDTAGYILPPDGKDSEFSPSASISRGRETAAG